MERGAGASNLRMRFNLASVKPGTVELSKKLKGVDNASNKLIQYPYQIWYQTAEYLQNEYGTYVLDGDSNRIITDYHTPVLLSQPSSNAYLTGQVYAVYKGTKKLIPYKQSMKIGGITYNNVFLLKAGETGYCSITPIDEGGSVSGSGRTYSGTERTENYTVNYQLGGSTGHNENIRNDTVTNSRPGIQIYKTDWNGDNYLSGAVFTLKDSDGHDVGHATYTSDTDGLVTTAYLNEGIFTLKMINLFQNF